MNTITIIARLLYLYFPSNTANQSKMDMIMMYTVYVHLIYIRTHQPIRDEHDVVVYVHRVRTPYYIKQIITIHNQILRMNTYQASFLTFLGEKPNEQVSWVGNPNIDEVMPWEVRNLCYLMNAILLQTVDKEVNKLRKELCCGCKVDHPSQRRHDCIMMSEEEGWIKHGKKAIK